MTNEKMLIILAVLAVGLVGLVAWGFFKAKEFRKKIKLLEDVIEKLANDVYKFQKFTKESKEREKQGNAGIESGLNSFYREIKEVHEIIKSDRNYFEEKMIKLENRVRDFGHIGGTSDVDEKRIIALYQEGWSVDSIAKELRIGRGEVEFTLKLADI